MQKVIILLAILISSSLTQGQNITKIFGKINGLGSGSKIFLGNKPIGIGLGFEEKRYDSTFSYNDSFYFKFNTPKIISDFSIETNITKGWISFIIDTGNIYIIGDTSNFYFSKVSGSNNNNLNKKFIREYYLPWNKMYFILNDSVMKYQNKADSTIFLKYDDSLKNLMKIYRESIVAFYLRNVKKSPFVSFRILNYYPLSIISDKDLKRYFKMLPKSIQKYREFESVSYKLNSLKKNITVGSKLPNFSFTKQDQETVSLFSIKHKYKLISLWASWCGPCLNEIPQLDSLQKKLAHKGLAILALNVDNSPVTWKNNISKFTFNCEHLYQGGFSESKLYKYFNISSIPFLVLIDENNKIIKYNIKIEEIQKFVK